MSLTLVTGNKMLRNKNIIQYVSLLKILMLWLQEILASFDEVFWEEPLF